MYTLRDFKIGDSGFIPSIRSYASNYGSSNTASVTLPADIVAGDYIVVFIGSNYGVSTGPSQFTELIRLTGSYHSIYAGGKTASGAEASTSIAATLSGSEPWNMWAVVIKGTNAPFGYAGARATSGTSLDTGMASNRKNNLFLVYGSVRANAATVSSNLGDLLSSRTADTSLSSAVFSGESGLPGLNATVMSSKTTTGISCAIVSIAAT